MVNYKPKSAGPNPKPLLGCVVRMCAYEDKGEQQHPLQSFPPGFFEPGSPDDPGAH